MSEISIVIRTADQAHSAKLDVLSAQTGADVIQGAVDHWKLPADVSYSLVSVTSGKSLQPAQSLGAQGVKNGDTLEVQPVLVAGAVATGSAATGTVAT